MMKRRMCGCLGDYCTHDEVLCRCLGCQVEAVVEMDAHLGRPAPAEASEVEGSDRG